MTENKQMTAREVADLYDVHIVTVYRWVDRDLFDAGTVETYPGAIRDRVMFDRAKVLAQHERETVPK